MSPPSARTKAVLAAAWLVFAGAGVAMVVASFGVEATQIVANGAYVAVGTLLIVRRRGNIIGPLLLANGVGWNLVMAGWVIADEVGQSGDVDAAGWIALAATASTIPLLWLFVALWLLFPDGTTTSAAASRLMVGSGVFAAGLTVAFLFARPQVIEPTAHPYPHPFIGDGFAAPLADALLAVTIPLLAAQVVAVGMLVARFRHAAPVERRQIGWVATAAIVYFALSIINVATDPVSDVENGFLLFDAIGFVLIPIAMGIAIMRYRLYEIDTIINRSLVFGALTAFIAGVYVAIVVGVGSVIGGDGFGLSIVASALVAMAFQPVRRRVQLWANRLVYGPRASPYEVLVRFSRRSAELPDEELLERIPQLVVDGTGAATAALWTRTEAGFRIASVWPSDTPLRHVAGLDHFTDSEADFSLPVYNGDDLLGGLSLAKSGGEQVTPAEEELLASLASGLGLALRNARLTSELRDQLGELEASRERVLAASDEARRALEHDLDSGPQQQLAALKVKLGPTRTLAERAGAERTADLLAQLELDAGAAIQSVRDFATGIFPPLLEAEGLEVAIAQQARSAAVRVSISSEAVDRYARDVEAAVYFSVLEALQNTAKYAEASAVAISLVDDGDALRFEVRDNGRGFDPAQTERGAGLTGIADRLDTVGGSVSVDSAPGAGTAVAGSVPIRSLVTAP